VQDADELYAQKKYKDAINVYKIALEANPEPQDILTIYYNQGLAFYKQKEYQKSLESFKKYTSLNTANKNACYSIGLCRSKLLIIKKLKKLLLKQKS
jgi:tetratricopeptide (TPR) repeat protein